MTLPCSTVLGGAAMGFPAAGVGTDPLSLGSG